MKITPHHQTYLCLTKLTGDDRIRFPQNLAPLSHFVVNEKMAVILFEGSIDSLVNHLFHEIKNGAGITLIPLGRSDTIIGGRRNAISPISADDVASVFDK